MIKLYIANSAGHEVDTREGIEERPVIVSESLRTLACHWSSTNNTASETLTAITARPGESVMLTDIIITSDRKVNSSSVTVQFSDGTNTEVLIDVDGAEAPIQFTHTFQGGVRGWKDADVQIVTNQAAMNVITFIGYVHLSSTSTKTYAVWNDER